MSDGVAAAVDAVAVLVVLLSLFDGPQPGAERECGHGKS